MRGLLMISTVGLAMFALASPALAQDSVVHVGLLDMTAVASGAASPGFGMGSQQGRGFGMMFGGGYGMMGGGGYGPGMMGMGMMSIRADQTSFKAGNVTFDVTNYSRSLVHEMLVVAVDSPQAPLPYDYQTSRIVEDQVKSLGETGELQPNQSKSVTVDLTPGSYVLICNVAGHYAAGMATPIVVTQ